MQAEAVTLRVRALRCICRIGVSARVQGFNVLKLSVWQIRDKRRTREGRREGGREGGGGTDRREEEEEEDRKGTRRRRRGRREGGRKERRTGD